VRIQYLGNALDLMNPLRNGMAIFIEAGPQRVDQFGALVDEPFSGAKQNRPALLLCSLRLPCGDSYDNAAESRF
jgi:hypothetical protein